MLRFITAPGILLPRFRRIKTVFTLHDWISVSPATIPPVAKSLVSAFHVSAIFNAADVIIAVSEHTSRDAQSLLAIAPEKITVIGELSSHTFVRSKTQPFAPKFAKNITYLSNSSYAF